MYLELGKLAGINQFKCLNNELFVFNQTSKLLKISLSNLATVWSTETKTQYGFIDINKELLVVYSIYLRLVVLNKAKGIIQVGMDIPFYPLKALGSYLLGTFLDKENKTFHASLIDCETGVLENRFALNGFVGVCANISGCLVVQRDWYDLACYSFFENKFLWQSSIQSFFTSETETVKIQGTPALTSNFVCVCVCDDSIRNSYILGLDINSGKLMWQVSGGWFEVFDNYAYTFYGKYLKSIQIGKIDTATGKKEEFDLTAEFIKYNVPMDAGHFCIADNYLYMSLHSKGYVIVLNLLTMQIEEAIQIPITEKAWQIQTPQVSGNKLFVLDQGNTLHIYERE